MAKRKKNCLLIHFLNILLPKVNDRLKMSQGPNRIGSPLSLSLSLWSIYCPLISRVPEFSERFITFIGTKGTDIDAIWRDKDRNNLLRRKER